MILSAIVYYENGTSAKFAGNQDIATQSRKVGRGILVYIIRLKILYRLEVCAVGAKGARNGRNNQNASGAVVRENIITNCAVARDCMDTPAELIGYQDLPTIGPET
jgi:hypothetical protein